MIADHFLSIENPDDADKAFILVLAFIQGYAILPGPDGPLAEVCRGRGMGGLNSLSRSWLVWRCALTHLHVR